MNATMFLANGPFRVRNGSLTPETEGFANQTHVTFLGKLSFEDVTVGAHPILVKLDSLLSCFFWIKVPQNISW